MAFSKDQQKKVLNSLKLTTTLSIWMEKAPVFKAKSFVCRSVTQPSYLISNMTLISSKFASEDVLCPHSHDWKVSKLLGISGGRETLFRYLPLVVLEKENR